MSSPGTGLPETAEEAVAWFADEDRAFLEAVRLRWPDGTVLCPGCGGEELRFVTTRRTWRCSGCERQFSVRTGTVFEDSPLRLGQWMLALWLEARLGHRLSSYELARTVGVTQRTGWRMLRRIRGGDRSVYPV